MITGHGDDAYQFEHKIVSNFSSNVYNKFDLKDLKKFLWANISSIHSYPEPDALTLRKLISRKLSISPEEIGVTNGATEAIYLIAQAFRGSKTAVVIPTFREYEDACEIHEHSLYFIESLEDIEPDTQLIWLCNPNNPTGKIYDKEYLEKVISNNPNTCFIIDQSYAAFTNNKIWSANETLKHSNAILLHSLTKCYAIPGLRLGYITAQKDKIDKIKHYSMPWSVNQLAQLAGLYLLENVSYDFSDYLLESQRVQKQLAKVSGIKVYASDMHFFLCQLEKGKASDLKKFLIETEGFLIRDAANFRGLNESYFRIAVQDQSNNNLLVKAIEEWIRLSF
ncbi:aminotransferase class I/II-fold pyridoxal phosphate-dependent enzyme [Dysgonomonas sp. GY617]|uniref:aminotransferase class I/II-fold pyridoxal phosphate-dependent enzyme n=1 Tax=Dysgonomonas sp. GY617 TaxID=2780420 RepID=UPI00188454AF|nr:aminotransferase class I/II-fold pyridoxal phosphate-dependent enzyme [Dysgonomonas sp. GY617]MBF0578169.1 aminotransferase class I/II-fold pyridoxal phosphate-dependent enzyme [Dysgonomonas sp. GY617]